MVDVTLPQFSANMRRITLGRFVSSTSPFKRMLDNIGLQGSANVSNRISAHESIYGFDRINRLNKLSRNGVQVQGSASTAGTIMKVVTATANVSGTYIGSVKQIRMNYAEGSAPVRDTVFGYLDGFNYRTSVDMNTRVYGMYSFRKGNLKAIRHVVMPSGGISYTPYSNYRDSYIDNTGRLVDYSPFDIAAYSPQSNIQGLNANFSVRQSLEAKVRDKTAAKSSATKKIMLIDNFNMATSYNMFADSLNWNGLNMSASTSLFNKVNLAYRSAYSFYDRDSTGKEINRYLIDTQNKLMRMRNTGLQIGFGLKSKERNKIDRADQDRSKEEHDLLAESKGSLIDMSVPWNLNVSYSLDFINSFDNTQRRDTISIRQGLIFQGNITLFKYWAFVFNSGLDLNKVNYNNFRFRDIDQSYISTTTLGLTWDLHCWEFTASYVPFGQRKSYMFQLNIKSPLLQDAKIQRRGNLGDSQLMY